MLFGLSGTEVIVILVVALLVLGPAKLPGLARSLGKTLRDFKRATNGIRESVETEFYRMDSEEPRKPASATPVATDGKALIPADAPADSANLVSQEARPTDQTKH